MRRLLVVGIFAIAGMILMMYPSFTGGVSFVDIYPDFEHTPDFSCVIIQLNDIVWHQTFDEREAAEGRKDKYYAGRESYAENGIPGKNYLSSVWSDAALLDHLVNITEWERHILCNQAANRCIRNSEAVAYTTWQPLSNACRNWLNYYKTIMPRCCEPEPAWPAQNREQSPQKPQPKPVSRIVGHP